ncbi:MAG TPA: GDSL-type esterase/lipase family protein, partial [Candidatus Dormibacteraeota bacterium]|nr:GDSL-type esterase/lipase family protein [Candidatus Dormibacteraeota bacterium]
MRAIPLACAAAAAALAACGGPVAPAGLPPPVPTATATAAPQSPTGTPAASETPSPDTLGQQLPERGEAVSIPPAGAPPRAGHAWFLAVGDSITSGYTVDPSRAGVNSAWPLDLQRLLAGRGRSWSLYDVACAGETLESYETACHDRGVATVLDGRSQRQAALDAVAAHRADLRLIAVDLGSNDLLRALESGSPVDDVADTVRTRLAAIVTELQAAAPGVPVIIG